MNFPQLLTAMMERDIRLVRKPVAAGEDGPRVMVVGKLTPAMREVCRRYQASLWFLAGVPDWQVRRPPLPIPESGNAPAGLQLSFEETLV